MKSIRLFLCLVMPMAFGFGCTSSTPQKTDFLSGNEQMHPGKYLQMWWTAGPIDKQTLSKIYIEPIDVTRIHDFPEISAAYASNFLAQTVAYQISGNSTFEFVGQPSAATARIALAITYMTPGSVGGRAFAGEIGMGDSIVQMDGKVMDASGKEIACFRHRRVDSASTGFEDLGGDTGQRLVRRSLDSISSKFAKELVASAGQ